MSPVERPVDALRLSRTGRTSWDSSRVASPNEPRQSLSLFPISTSSTSSIAPPTSHIPDTRVSAKALTDMQRMMSDQDRALLLFVQAVRVATTSQLRRAMPVGAADVESAARIARRRLQRLGEWRILDRLPTRAAGGRGGGSDSYVWFVGPAGRRLLARMGFTGKRLGTPSERFLCHALGVTETVLRLREANSSGELELLSWEAEPACWRSFLSYGGGRIVLKPDLAVRIGAGAVYETRYLVEYDCATEAAGSLTAKLKRHAAYRSSGTEIADHGGDPKVLWLMPDDKRCEQLRRLIAGLAEHDRDIFEVTTHEDGLDLLIRESRS
jgi:hypothetical protein